MNIDNKVNKSVDNVNLNENQQMHVVTSQQKIDSNKLETILTVKSKQFEFESGILMGAINFRTETIFSLWYHNQKTNTVEEFINSVRNFIESSGNILTDKDEIKLQAEWYKVNEI